MSHLFLSRNIESGNARSGASLPLLRRTRGAPALRGATAVQRLLRFHPRPAEAAVLRHGGLPGCGVPCVLLSGRFDCDLPMRRLFLSRNIEGATDAGRRRAAGADRELQGSRPLGPHPHGHVHRQVSSVAHAVAATASWLRLTLPPRRCLSMLVCTCGVQRWAHLRGSQQLPAA
jgi:hypothetical protein